MGVLLAQLRGRLWRRRSSACRGLVSCSASATMRKDRRGWRGFAKIYNNSAGRTVVTLQLDVRWGGADIDYIRASAADLVSTKPDVILVYAIRVLNAMQDATREIPVVFIASSDPVGLGLVKSLSHPVAISPASCFTKSPWPASWLNCSKRWCRASPGLGFLQPGKHKRVGIPTVDQGRFKVSRRRTGLASCAQRCQHREQYRCARTRSNSGLVLPTDVTTVVHRDLIVALSARTGCRRSIRSVQM